MVTGALFNSLKFGEVDSADYGIYIDGEGVFNAPARDVEMISVPGRNGDITLDLGRYENITVNYPAGIYGDDQTDFRERFSDFRNAVLSQKGYQRLSDTYHPDEFRMGVYASGLDINPVHYNEAGQFTLSFNCKPQRFLVDGEDEIAVTSGDTIENLTLFDASPLLEVEGYGNINIEGQSIDIENGMMGVIELPTEYSINGYFYPIDEVETGDNLTVQALKLDINLRCMTSGASAVTFNSVTGTSHQSDNYPPKHNITKVSESTLRDTLEFGHQYFTVGTNETKTDVYRYNLSYTNTSSQVITRNVDVTIEIQNRTYDGKKCIYVRVSSSDSYFQVNKKSYSLKLYADSTQLVLGHPTYIDLDLGDVYKIENDNYVSLNRWIIFGADLPTLKPGDNEVTFDNTITSLKIVPRWWKL